MKLSTTKTAPLSSIHFGILLFQLIPAIAEKLVGRRNEKFGKVYYYSVRICKHVYVNAATT